MKLLPAALFGLLFGLGLALSGMADPARVLGFLDVAGAWDPGLAFVMAAAVSTAAPLFALAGRRHGIAASAPATRMDFRLIGGAAIFGIGWGLAGICPGPALVDLAFAPWRLLPFLGAMILGLLLARR
ncbi:hypothetical protein MC45_00245 [Sphingomonas taxi]|jgi:uncharacterized membrane protein YedE/YeeE|uniref:Transporter n=1 Tax=Sphingomonas taxi TaxID=1549858 RepID=A0A097EC64_9SPHN|nr:DUF6691 family protein [Sphingomonas taxi]AIT05133.1 hypothetical protein MC45_00245 [Sphingomonas taxi]